MQTLRLASLAVLVPIGLLQSELGEAYPEPFDRPQVTDNQSADTSCDLMNGLRVGLGPRATKETALSGSKPNQLGPPGAPAPHHPNYHGVGVCRLDIGPLEAG